MKVGNTVFDTKEALVTYLQGLFNGTLPDYVENQVTFGIEFARKSRRESFRVVGWKSMGGKSREDMVVVVL
jgi:hypothetical protein